MPATVFFVVVYYFALPILVGSHFMSTPFFGPLNITVTKASRQLIQAQPLFPLESPGILSIPLRFLGAFLGTLASRADSDAERRLPSSRCARIRGWARRKRRWDRSSEEIQ